MSAKSDGAIGGPYKANYLHLMKTLSIFNVYKAPAPVWWGLLGIPPIMGKVVD